MRVLRDEEADEEWGCVWLRGEDSFMNERRTKGAPGGVPVVSYRDWLEELDGAMACWASRVCAARLVWCGCGESQALTGTPGLIHLVPAACGLLHAWDKITYPTHVMGGSAAIDKDWERCLLGIHSGQFSPLHMQQEVVVGYNNLPERQMLYGIYRVLSYYYNS